MFAIQNIKTGKFVYGTDKRYVKYRQLTSKNRMLTYESLAQAKWDFKLRKCGKAYRIVCLKTVEVKRVIPFDVDNKYIIDDGFDW